MEAVRTHCKGVSEILTPLRKTGAYIVGEENMTEDNQDITLAVD